MCCPPDTHSHPPLDVFQALTLAQRHVVNSNALIQATSVLAQVPAAVPSRLVGAGAEAGTPGAAAAPSPRHTPRVVEVGAHRVTALPAFSSVAIARLSQRLMGRSTCRVFLVDHAAGVLVAYVGGRGDAATARVPCVAAVCVCVRVWLCWRVCGRELRVAVLNLTL